MMYEMSGSRFLFRGVGTQITTALHRLTNEKSVLARKRPAETSSATDAEGIWLVCSALVLNPFKNRIPQRLRHGPIAARGRTEKGQQGPTTHEQ